MKRIPDNKGNVLMIVMVLFVMLSLSLSLGLIVPVLRSNKIAESELQSKQGYFASESGVEDVLYRLKNSKQVSSSETLAVGSSSATTTVTDISGGSKQVSAVGTSQNRIRNITATVTQGEGVAFSYGLQVGAGGVYLNSGTINGSIYSNGDITASSSGSNAITGSATAANSDALTADQSNGVTGTPASTIVFGNTTSSEDAAQSFTLTDESPLNKAQFYVKKTGSPSNATVYIVADNAGVPSTTYLASATLSASLVTTSYGWVDATFTTSPTLEAGTTYWLVINASSSASNYYTLGANTNGYANGSAKIGRYSTATWNATSPSTLDEYFKIYIGGQTSSILGDGQYTQLHIGSGGVGNASAATVNNTSTAGTIYCQSGTGNNKSCNTSQAAPSAQAWPISDSNIDEWKATAAAGTVTTGDFTTAWNTTNTFGPRKIIGNLNVTSGYTATLTGTLWVTGNLTLDGGALLKLSSAYGSGSGVVIVDGKVSISGGASATGSGTSGSYILIVSLSDCPTSSSCGSSNAVSLSGGAGAVVLIAQNGTISVSGGASAKQLTAYKMSVTGGSSVTYETGLANLNFNNSPSGSWVVNSWKETQ